jgi:hypothetical protein
VSLRSINLVLVIDPQSLGIRWWSQGVVRRQHDPDWNDRGTITVYDNNMHREHSRIQELVPGQIEANILLAGEDHDFYSWRRGKHDQTPGGGLLITSTEQGRVFETNARGEVVFEFVNRYSENDKVLPVSEARFLPPDYFTELPECES